MKLKDYLKKLPDQTGVYIFLNKQGKPLYVGRALSLKRRVGSYFRKDIDPRIAEMVSLAKRIKHIKTETVLESVILEANLIKKYWPKYNVKDRDNRSLVYIVIDTKLEYPKPLIIRARELEKFPNIKNTFGPYNSLRTAKTILALIRKIFPYSTCRPNSGKACFDYQIGLCPGACVGEILPRDYRQNIDNIILFLKGEKKRLLKNLIKQNPEKLAMLAQIQEAALITNETGNLVGKFSRIEGYDISHFAGKETYGSMVVFIDGESDNSLYRLFKIKEAPANDDLRSLEEMIIRRLKHKEWPYPDLMMIDGGKPQIDFITKVLAKENIKIPIVGISKFGGDKLVFPPKTKASIKELTQGIKSVLLAVRDEAHRFSLKSSRRKRQL